VGFIFKIIRAVVSPTERIDMKITLLPLVGLWPALIASPLHAQALGEPVLSTPGTATWLTETTSTGTRMVFTISGNTVLDWGQFNLSSGSELVFDFVGGSSVANMLNGTSPQTIAGNVTSNGSVGFFSPNASLRVSGTVTADNITVATLDVDPEAFNAGDTFTMTGGAGSTLAVSGTLSATSGSVVLAGRTVRLSGDGQLQASDAVRIGGGSEITVEKSGFGRRLKEVSGDGFVLHLGTTKAARIEIAAGKEIFQGGRLDTGSARGRIFLEIGQGGKIVRDGRGIMIGKADIVGERDRKGIGVGRGTDEVRAAVNNSVVTVPALKRPDGTTVSPARTLKNDVPMSASADSGRDRKRAAPQVASRGEAKPLVQRTSFFGMRGGSEKR
jgi:filamentous hemagglutinin family protein